MMGADEVAEGRAMLWTQSEGAADNDEAKGEEADFASTVRDMLLGGAEVRGGGSRARVCVCVCVCVCR